MIIPLIASGSRSPTYIMFNNPPSLTDGFTSFFSTSLLCPSSFFPFLNLAPSFSSTALDFPSPSTTFPWL
jgi:hypothetical protein